MYFVSSGVKGLTGYLAGLDTATKVAALATKPSVAVAEL